MNESLEPPRGRGGLALFISSAVFTVAFGVAGVLPAVIDPSALLLPMICSLAAGAVAVVWAFMCQYQIGKSGKSLTEENRQLRDALSEEKRRVARETLSHTADGLNGAIGETTAIMQSGWHDDGGGLFVTAAKAVEAQIGHRARVYVYAPADKEADIDEYKHSFSGGGDDDVTHFVLLFDSESRVGYDPHNPVSVRHDRYHHLAEVYRNGHAKIVGDAQSGSHARAFKGSQRRTFANVRIHDKGRPIGVLQADACEPEVINDSHTDFMNLVAQIFAVAMHFRDLSKQSGPATILGKGLEVGTTASGDSPLGEDADER